jgi:hypothetical protein
MKMSSSKEWHDPLVRKLIKRHRGRDPELIVAAAAESMLVEAGQDAFPIDVEGIASLLGIKRRVGEYSFAGRIYAEPNGQLVMDLSDDDSPPRRRFTCGHEITHTVFPGFTRDVRYRVDTTVGSNSRQRNEEEYLCDIGAAELLLPSALVREDYDLRRGLDEIENLSDAANASLEASANRLVVTSDEPVGLIVFEMGHKPADRAAVRKGLDVPRRLRVRYAKCNGISAYIPRFKSADDESVYAQALATIDTVKGDGQLPGDERQRPFLIEAKRYDRSGKDGAITQRVLALVRPA